MKAIILLFDSLNKHYLPPYGDTITRAPNFQRLAARCATFNNSYVGSMPCMPLAGSCTPAGIIFCIGSGGRWSRSTTPCRSS